MDVFCNGCVLTEAFGINFHYSLVSFAGGFSMSSGLNLANSRAFSSDTLAAGVSAVEGQQVKIESAETREEMERELKDITIHYQNISIHNV